MVAVCFPVVWWVKWIDGREVVRSHHAHHTIIIRQAPQQRFWFNPIDYFVDRAEVRSALVYSFEVYADSHSQPIALFSETDASFDPWKNASVKWIGPKHFVVKFNRIDTFECKFEQPTGATWRRL